MTLKNKKILITCGPTWVAIDDMRVISNKSTGELAHRIAQGSQKAGAKVTLLEGPVSHPWQGRTVRVKKFTYFDELAALLKTELSKRYDVIIHAAAVADYKPQKSYKTKLKSTAAQLKLNLTPTVKLINRIKRLAPESKLVGFKLESLFNESQFKHKAALLVRQADCDFVVTNSTKQRYRGLIFGRNRKILARIHSRGECAKRLVKLLKEHL